MKTYFTVDEYIASYPTSVQEKLMEIRKIINETAPEATEKISYGMPAYKGKKVLFYFGGFKDHVSFFPTAKGIERFKEELGNYKTSKGTVQFKLDQELPVELLKRMISARVLEDKL
jgi:uncharacterized protein YdhG (YjbR/CyaY superfamily)